MLEKNPTSWLSAYLLSTTSCSLFSGHTLDLILFMNRDAITTFLSRVKILFFLFPGEDDSEAWPANELNNNAKKRFKIWNVKIYLSG